MRFHTLMLCCRFLLMVANATILCAQKPEAISGQEVDRSVIAALSHQAATNPKVISHVDLTEPFATATQWTVRSRPGWEAASARLTSRITDQYSLCLVKGATPDCALHLYQDVRSDEPWFGHAAYHLLLWQESGVYANQEGQIKPAAVFAGVRYGRHNGNGKITTALSTDYERGADRFVRACTTKPHRTKQQSKHTFCRKRSAARGR